MMMKAAAFSIRLFFFVLNSSSRSTHHTVIGLSFSFLHMKLMASCLERRKKQKMHEMIMTNDQVVLFFFLKVTNMRYQRQCSVSDHNLINEECAFAIRCSASVNHSSKAKFISFIHFFSFTSLNKKKTKTKCTFAHGAAKRCELLLDAMPGHAKRRQQRRR